MQRYAEGTNVSVEKSRAEIEKVLMRYGADQFISGWDVDQALIGFRSKGRMVRLFLSLPAKDDKRFKYTPSRKWTLPPERQLAAWEQACRSQWRALALVVKAKLEAVEAGISTFDQEFMANIMLPDGGTVGQWMQPQIERAYKDGKMPLQLVAGTEGCEP